MANVSARKRGKFWEYRFESAKIDGKRRQITKGGYKTKKDALNAGNKALSEYNNSGLLFTPSEISVNDYLDEWLELYCRINLKTTTVSNYEKKIRMYIKPALGKYKLKSLSPSVLQLFINNLFNQGMSRNTLSVIKGILSNSLNYAVIPLKYIENSPMLYIKLPSPRAKPKVPTKTAPHVYIPPEWISKIFERFPEGSSVHIPMMFAYKGGLRLGEAFGVEWDDIDLVSHTLCINRQIQWDENLKCWYLSNPKYDSIREIRIDSEFIELLKREKYRQERAAQYYADYYVRYYVNRENLINTKGEGRPASFVAVRENGTLINPRTMQHTNSIIHNQLGFKEFDFHSLRYTHATMLAEKSISEKYVQKRLGHKNVLITMQIYQQFSPKIKKMGDDLIDQIYTNRPITKTG